MNYVCAVERADIETGGDYITKRATDAREAAEEFAAWAWDNMDGWEWLRDDGEVYVSSEGEGVRLVAVSVDFESTFFASVGDLA